jgi:O-antigen/teichoic acid export membrane protein
MERPIRNLLAGTLTKYLFLFVSIVTGIFLMPFTMHHLGTSEYGLWMLVASMTAYFQLLDLGYGNGLVRQVTQADARAREDEMNVVLSTFVVVYGGLGVLALAGVAGLVLLVVPRFPNLTAEQIVTAQWVLAILGVRVAVAFPMSVFGAVTTARQRFALTTSIAIAVTLLQAAATVLILNAGYGLVPLVAATTSINLASYLAYAAAARHTFPGLRLSVRRFSTQQVREVTAFSAYVFLITIAIQLGYNIDNVVIGAFAGTSAVAVYAVAFRLADYQRQLCNQFNGLLFPVVVRFKASNQTDALRATLVDGTRIALGLIAGVSVCLLAFAAPVVRIWMGTGFEGSLAPLYVLAVAGVILVGAGPLGNVLLATGRQRLVAFSCLGEAVVNLGLTLWLVRRYGIVGAAIGTLVAVTVSNVFVQLPAACRTIGVPIGSFLRLVGGPALVALVPAVLAAYWLQVGAEAASLLDVIGRGALVAAVYVLAFVGGGLSGAERRRYVGSVREVTLGAWRAREAV